MLKKFFSFAFAVITFLYVSQPKAMENPETQTQIAETKQTEIKSPNTLMYLAALAVNKYKNNKNLDLNCLPLDLKEYYKNVMITENCKYLNLKQFITQYGIFRITKKNLNQYNELIYQLDCMNVNIRPILSAINDIMCIDMSRIRKFLNAPPSLQCLEARNRCMTLEHINILLTILIKHKKSMIHDEILSKKEIPYLRRLIYLAFCSKKRPKLQKLLIMNNLFPPLDYIMGNNESFLMYLATNAKWKFFKQIINKEKNKDNDYWAKLFSIKSYKTGFNILHTIVHNDIDPAIYLIISQLMKEKGLLNQFINIKSSKKYPPFDIPETPLMIAAKLGNYSILKFLLDDGANKNDKNNDGLTALDYAEMESANLQEKIAFYESLDLPSENTLSLEKKRKLDICIRFLKKGNEINSCYMQ